MAFQFPVGATDISYLQNTLTAQLIEALNLKQ
jgi:hypothetical protein